MDMDGKAVLFDEYTVNDVAKAFFSGILLGYTNYKQVHPENNKVSLLQEVMQRDTSQFSSTTFKHIKIAFQTGLNQITTDRWTLYSSLWRI